jgi:signal transduction histidine kinase
VVGGAVAPLLINKASADPRFRNHPGLLVHGIESYIAVPLYRQDGSYFGTLCAADYLPADLTEESFDLFHLLSQLVAFELEADEQQQVREVQHEALTEFISTASHNLRTPLTALRLAMSAVGASVGDRLCPDEQRMMENVRRNIDRLNIHVSDLLTFNQSEANALHVESIHFDLRTVVTNAIGVTNSLISEQGHTLEIDLSEPLETQGDPRRLEQVIVNLLENALQYSAPGTSIGISGRATPDMVRLSVTDRGPGVPAEHRERIFQRFYRVSPSVSGSGLGLAIARTIVNMHGGRIWVDDNAEGGAAFHVTLPHCTSREERRERDD